MKVLLSLLMLFLIPVAIAADDYNQTGYYDKNFQGGRGIFNSEINPSSDIITFAKSFSGTARQTPLINDLDRDNKNEIIILQGNTMIIYQDRELNIVDTYTFPSIARISNMITYDIDADNDTEIIFIEEQDELMHIVSFDGSSIINETPAAGLSVPVSSSGAANAGEFVIQCRDSQDCLAMYSQSVIAGADPSGSTRRLYASYMNSSGLHHEVEIDTTGGNVRWTWCMPAIREMTIEDYDNDGDKEYIMSFMKGGGHLGNIDETYAIYYLNALTNGTITEDKANVDITSDTSDFLYSTTSSTGWACNNVNSVNNDGLLAGQFFTSPLVHDFDLSEGNSETAIAYNRDNDEYVIRLISADGSQPIGNRFPQATQGEGRVISNLMLANAFPDSGNNDVCAFGYEFTSTDPEPLELICGSKQTSASPETMRVERALESDENYNITSSYGNWFRISHSVQESNALSTESSQSSDLNEFINAYGVNSIDYSSCSIFGNCDLVRLMKNPQEKPLALISADVEGASSEDLIGFSSNNIYYFDDQLTTEGPSITSVTFNPCVVDSIIQQNTTLQVTVVSTDNNPSILDQDAVNINVSIYSNSPDEQKDGISGAASGSSNAFLFNANKTGNAKTITVSTYDDNNPAEFDIITQTFSVATNGIEFGDSSCSLDFVTDEEDAEISALGVNQTSNIVKQGLSVMSGTGLGNTGNFFLIMMIVGLFFIFGKIMGRDTSSIDPHILFAAFLITEFALLLFGTITGVVPIGLTITVILISIIPLALFIRNLIMGIRSGGGI